MNAPARLSLYGTGLVAVFIAAFFIAGAVVPEETVQNWVDDTSQSEHHGEGGHDR